MDIKKIIKEEMDDFDFVKDTDPNNIFKNIFDSNPNTTYIGIDDELTKDEAEKILSLLNKMGYHSQLKKPLTDWSRGYTLWVTRNSDSIVMGHRRADYDPSDGDMLVPNIFKDVINESDDLKWMDDSKPSRRDLIDFNKGQHKTTKDYTDVEVGDKLVPSGGYIVWTVLEKTLRWGEVDSETGWVYSVLLVNEKTGKKKTTYMCFMNHPREGVLNLTQRPWSKITNINESEDDFGWADEIDVLTTKMSFEDMITLLNRVFDGSDDYYLKANPYSGLSIYDMDNGLMDSFNKHDYEDGISINDITNELTRFGDHVPKLVQKEYTELADMIINHTKQKMTEGG